MKLNVNHFLWVAIAVSVGSDVAATRAMAKDADVARYHSLQIEIRSWQPDSPIQTHRRHSKGSCSMGGTVGVGVGGVNGFGADVRCVPDKERIRAEISIRPATSNHDLKPSKTAADLSDMRSKFMEVTRDSDGRVYFLIVRPEIIEAKQPTTFSIDQLSPYDWDFPSSPVVLDDEVYVGRIGMSGGSLAGITIAGVGVFEFSLRPLRDAEPIGLLRGGILTIKTKEHAIVVSGVRNGAAKETLDGPFKVWVRQLSSDVTTDGYKQLMRKQLETVVERKREGDLSITDETVERFRGFVDRDRPMLIGSSARDVRENELAQ